MAGHKEMPNEMEYKRMINPHFFPASSVAPGQGCSKLSRHLRAFLQGNKCIPWQLVRSLSFCWVFTSTVLYMHIFTYILAFAFYFLEGLLVSLENQ